MMLSVPCPNCRKLLQVVDTSTDCESQCAACGTLFRPAGSEAQSNQVSSGFPQPAPQLPTHSVTPLDYDFRLLALGEMRHTRRRWTATHIVIAATLAAFVLGSMCLGVLFIFKNIF